MELLKFYKAQFKDFTSANGCLVIDIKMPIIKEKFLIYEILKVKKR